MAWSEIKGTSSGEMDEQDFGSTRRLFKVWGGVSVATILSTPELVDNGFGQFLPAKGSAHPDYIDGSMVLIRYECAEDSVIVMATAIYDNRPGGGNLKNPDKRIGTSYERRKIDLWYGSKVLVEVAPGDPEPQSRWNVKPTSVIENFMRLTYRVIVPKKDPYGQEPGWDGNAMELVRNEIGAIHRFGFDGAPVRAWQFSGADPADRNLEEAVTVTYSWIADPGTVLFAIENPDPNIDPADSFIWPPQDKPDGYGKKFVRPPFTNLIWSIDFKGGVDPDGNPIPPTYKPLFFTVRTSFDNPQGWQTLPGLLP